VNPKVRSRIKKSCP